MTSPTPTGYWIKDATGAGGKREFIRHRNPSPTPQFVDGGEVVTADYAEVYDGLTPAPVASYDSTIDGGGVSG